MTMSIKFKNNDGVCSIKVGARSRSWCYAVARQRLDNRYGAGNWSFV